MDSIREYDWSTLDRELLTEIAFLSSYQIVGKTLSPVEISARIREHLRLFKIPVNIVSAYHKQTTRSWIWVGGLYYSYKDRRGKKSITLRLQYNPEDRYIKLNHKKFRRICVSIADTILHEIIHMRQYRRRCFKTIPGYESFAESSKKRLEQTYLGHYDEIDAYSFNIACMLRDKFKSDYKKIVTYLSSDLSDNRLKNNSYLLYLKTFDHDHTHPVIKKLKKKIMYYLPYAELGKPYKTSDWLKA